MKRYLGIHVLSQWLAWSMTLAHGMDMVVWCGGWVWLVGWLAILRSFKCYEFSKYCQCEEEPTSRNRRFPIIHRCWATKRLFSLWRSNFPIAVTIKRITFLLWDPNLTPKMLGYLSNPHLPWPNFSLLYRWWNGLSGIDMSRKGQAMIIGLKHMRQMGWFPDVGLNIEMFETTT